VAVVGVLVLGLAFLVIDLRSGPRLVVPQDVPVEVTSLVDATWASFLDAFPAQRRCIGEVTLVLVRHVEGGDASFSPSERTIHIEIPTTPERFPESLAHELGHVVDRSCGGEAAVGDAFRLAQGIPATRGWSAGDHWFDEPSEQFAETVVQIVEGRRLLHADVFDVTDDAIAIVSDWGLHG